LYLTEKMHRTIEMRFEMNAVFLNLSQGREAVNLKPSAVCQYRPVPVHESVQAPEGFDDFVSRTKILMISIGEDNLSTNLF